MRTILNKIQEIQLRYLINLHLTDQETRGGHQGQAGAKVQLLKPEQVRASCKRSGQASKGFESLISFYCQRLGVF